MWTPDDVDATISAELPPDPTQFPEGSVERQQAAQLEAIVLQRMLHNECTKDGRVDKTCPCVDKDSGQCKFHYPKEYSDVTHWAEDAVCPIYRRRSPEQGGRSIEQVSNGGHKRVVTNAYVVPYSPYLCLRYGMHINVEVCVSVKGVKYLFKYVFKGSDRQLVAVTEAGDAESVDEITSFQDLRSFGSAEAVWRIYHFKLFGRSPAVVRLPVHLPTEQHVQFNEHNAEDVAASEPITKLEAFFVCVSLEINDVFHHNSIFFKTFDCDFLSIFLTFFRYNSAEINRRREHLYALDAEELRCGVPTGGCKGAIRDWEVQLATIYELPYSARRPNQKVARNIRAKTTDMSLSLAERLAWSWLLDEVYEAKRLVKYVDMPLECVFEKKTRKWEQRKNYQKNSEHLQNLFCIFVHIC